MNYKSVVVTRRGGPEVLQIVENDLREPAAGEVRIKILASGVGRTDVNYRYGYSPFSPKVPFVPGYSIVGIVDAVGPQKQPVIKDAASFAVGDRVAALIGFGGYAEMIYLAQEHLVMVPESLDLAEAATLILNYVTAYQMLHRVAKVKTGDKVLLIGASGGVGTALLQLGKLAGLKMYGTASPGKHPALIALGAIPIDYTSRDFVEEIHQAEPDGLDFVFDGMGGKYGDRGMSTLRRGGKLVGSAPPSGVLPLLFGMLKLALVNLLPNGKSADFYGISALYMRDKKPFMQDLALLFKLLEAGKIKPIIARKFPLLKAAEANQLLESGQVTGNIILLAADLL